MDNFGYLLESLLINVEHQSPIIVGEVPLRQKAKIHLKGHAVANCMYMCVGGLPLNYDFLAKSSNFVCETHPVNTRPMLPNLRVKGLRFTLWGRPYYGK